MDKFYKSDQLEQLNHEHQFNLNRKISISESGMKKLAAQIITIIIKEQCPENAEYENLEKYLNNKTLWIKFKNASVRIQTCKPQIEIGIIVGNIMLDHDLVIDQKIDLYDEVLS